MVQSTVESRPSYPLYNDVTSSSEDEFDRPIQDDENEERMLSTSHGEATESSSGVKKEQTDAQIASALKANDGTRRKRRQVLTESDLTGSKGLIYVRRNFATKLRYRPPNFNMSASNRNVPSKRKRMELEIHAAATYSSNLMQCYEEFATELMPTEHFTDTLNKIQDLGSKKQVREYLDIMREEVCKEHIEGIHGKEKTGKLFEELEYGLESHKRRMLDEAANETGLQDENQSPSTTSDAIIGLSNTERMPEQRSDISNKDFDSGNDLGTGGKDPVSPPRDNVKRTRNFRLEPTDSSDEDEVEATFDDVTGFDSPERDMKSKNLKLKHSEDVHTSDDIHSRDNVCDSVSAITDTSIENNPQQSLVKKNLGSYQNDLTEDMSIEKKKSNDHKDSIITTDFLKENELDKARTENLGADTTPEHGVICDVINEKENDRQLTLSTQLSTFSQPSQENHTESQERLTFDTSQEIVEAQSTVGTQIGSTHSTTPDNNNNVDVSSMNKEKCGDIDQKSENSEKCQSSKIVPRSEIGQEQEQTLLHDSSHDTNDSKVTSPESKPNTIFSQDY